MAIFRRGSIADVPPAAVRQASPYAPRVSVPAVNAPTTILVVDDEEAVRRLVVYPFERDGYRVLQAGTGEGALEIIGRERPDLILLDLMLPGIDGYEVCRRVRATSMVPIIMLTARDDEIDKVLGLELGADDYVTKPFSVAELRSRVRAVLRRSELSPRPEEEGERLESDDVVLDLARRTCDVRGKRMELTYVEFEILAALMRSPGRVLSRRALLEAVWESADYREQRTIDVHVRHLREKLEADPSEPLLIQTVRGVGYRFRG
jgi:DNA-binding response OmpR family regulator